MNTSSPPLFASVQPLQWAVAVCGALAILSSHFDVWALFAVLKPLTMVLLIVFAWQTTDRLAHPSASWLLLAGLCLSVVGDVCLLVPEGFIPGLVAFLLAHMCYIALFGRDAPWLAHKGATLGVLAVGASTYAYLWTHGLPPALRIPVGIYVLVIALMASQAIGRATVLRTPGAQCVAWGALSFMVSDTVLAFGKFVQPLPGIAFWVLGTYYLAQWLIVHGMLQALHPHNQNKSY